MTSGRSRSFFVFIFVTLFVLLMLTGSLPAQTGSGTLRGRVTDPTGAVIPQATVTATGGSGQKATTVTDNQGAYELKGLSPGTYTITTFAKGFAVSTEQNFAISADQAQRFDIALEIQVEQEKVEVQEESTTVSVNPSENASSIVIKGKDLEALSDDPDELQQELEALAGPSAGPNGGQIYIDGFTAGQLPPKSSIREIRINQNPFSAEYDKLGYGRIEIFTKPGTDQFHGQFMLDGNSSAFDALSPFAPDQPPFHSELFNGSLSGPLGKKASFFFTAQVRDIYDSNIVNAVVPTTADPNPTTANFTQAVPSQQTRINIGPRFDFQITPSNTLTVRYQYFRDSEDNSGVGQFSLPSQAYNTVSTEDTVQISDTQVVSTNIVNETRFQYLHDSSSQTVMPISSTSSTSSIPDPCAQLHFQATVSVLGAFTCGDNQIGNGSDVQNHYELQNYTSIVHRKHLIKFGGRLRAVTDSNVSLTNFNGVFTFSTLSAYEPNVSNPQMGPSCLAKLIANLPSVPSPDALAACGASQFSITTGQPLSQVTMVDAGLYAQDEWRIRPNVTLSYGLRFETQNDIHDHGDFAPRLSFAWGLGGGGKKAAPKTVLRAGYGIFYDRVPYNLVLQTERLNGFTQQQTIVAANTAMGQTSPTSYQFASGLRAPSTMQTAIGVERQVAKSTTVAVTYINSYGEHQLFLRNANAPLPGTYPLDPIRPFGGTDNIYQYDSEGIFRQNQVIANFRTSIGSKLSLFGFYTLNYANSDLGSGGGGGGGGTSVSFISHQYDPIADYGRSQFDVRDRGVVGGTISLPYAFRLNPFIIVSSGVPFNVTVGQDVNGDSIFNDRPGPVTASTPPSNIRVTQWGTFNAVPTPSAPTIPINVGTGTTLFTLNLRISKTFGFGKEVGAGQGARTGQGGGGGGRGGGPGGGLGGRGLGGAAGGAFMTAPTSNRRYNLTFSVSARNVLNRVNLAPPTGNLDSPLFGESNALAGGPYSYGSATRRIDLQALFSF
ncbi:MAG: carboxypeptidase regulatory-like domain-containing protein [Terriglobales bacterium]